jgi:nucleoside-diphosphate-sugar epimerase
MKKVLILGVNGFIGHHLSKRILETTDWHVYGMDMQNDRLGDLVSHPRMHFFEGDITINREWVEYHIRKCDVILQIIKEGFAKVNHGCSPRRFTLAP